MKKILLTGGSGFIGKNIAESYLAQKYQIIAPKRDEIDLLKDQTVADFFSNHKYFDVVIHSACKPGHRNAADTSGVFYSNNRMFFNLLKHSDYFGKMLIMGSGAIYDGKNYLPKMKEEYFGTHIPEDEHGFSKYVIGREVERSSKVIDLRIFGIFGKYEDYAIRFISNAICKAIFDLPITLRQNRKFDYLYIDDLMPILEYFIENNAEYCAYNVTPDYSIELLEIAKIVKEISGKNLPINVANPGLGLEYSGDNSRLHGQIKNLEFTPIKNTVFTLYNWYLAHQNQINKQNLLTDK